MGFLLYHKLSRAWKVQASSIIGNRTAYIPFWTIILLNDLPRSLWLHCHICALPARCLLSRAYVGVYDTHLRNSQPPWETICCLVSSVSCLKEGCRGWISAGCDRPSGKEDQPSGEESEARGPSSQAHARSRCVEVGMCWESLGRAVRKSPFHLTYVIFMHAINSGLHLKTLAFWTYVQNFALTLWNLIFIVSVQQLSFSNNPVSLCSLI